MLVQPIPVSRRGPPWSLLFFAIYLKWTCRLSSGLKAFNFYIIATSFEQHVHTQWTHVMIIASLSCQNNVAGKWVNVTFTFRHVFRVHSGKHFLFVFLYVMNDLNIHKTIFSMVWRKEISKIAWLMYKLYSGSENFNPDAIRSILSWLYS